MMIKREIDNSEKQMSDGRVSWPLSADEPWQWQNLYQRVKLIGHIGR